MKADQFEGLRYNLAQMKLDGKDRIVLPVETLEALLDACQPPKSGNGWIPVSERRPDDGRSVLAYIVHESKLDGEAGSLVAWFNGIAWFASSGGMLCRPSKVTHWMPLPDGPSQPHKPDCGSAGCPECEAEPGFHSPGCPLSPHSSAGSSES